jgi:iron complex outermembrane recepter protein
MKLKVPQLALDPRSSLLRCCIAAILAPAVSMTAHAQDPQQQSADEITVTGTRIVRSGMVTPVPVTSVQTSELQKMSGGTMFDAIVQLPPFFSNQSPEQVNGGQNSGGSNLNLRGAGLNRTLVLLDGRRVVPTNRFGAVDVAMFPEELVSAVETVTGGASASYGTDAVAGVVNFILDNDFDGFKGHAQVGETTYGDGENYEAGFAFGFDIGERGHFIGSVEKYHVDAISSFESMTDRDFIRNVARVTNPSPTGPRNLTLPNVSPTNWNHTGIINEPGVTGVRPRSTLDKLVFNPNGTTSPLAFSGVGAINGGCNCQAEPTLTYGGDRDEEIAASNDRRQGFFRYEYEIGDNITFFEQLLVGRNEVSDRRESISFVLTWAPRIFSDNAYLPADVAAAMRLPGNATPVPGSPGVQSVGFALFGINGPDTPLGDARQITENKLYSNTIGFEVELDREGFLDGWNIDAYYQYGKNHQYFDTDNGIRVDRIPLALDAVRHPTTGQIVCNVAIVNPAFSDCVPMNIFGGVQNITPEAARYIVDDYKHATQHTDQDFLEFVMTGDIWQGWGAGVISGAFGASYRSEGLEQKTPDPTDEFPATPSGVLLSDLGVLPVGIRGLVTSAGVPAGDLPAIPGIPGVRNVPAGFLGDANSSSVTFSSLRAISGGYDVREVFGELNLPIVASKGWANSFEVTTALRWADYSGSGEIWAGKIGANWQVTDAVRLRMTQSRDVRAATLRERFDETRGGVNVNDPLRGGQPISTASFSGGNPNVNPEEADTTTAGVVFQPRRVDGLSMSLDWYEIDVQDAIAQLTAQGVVNGCAGVGGAPPDLTLCPNVHRGPDGVITRVDSFFINLQRALLEGVDFEMSYATGPVNVRMFASRLFKNSTQTAGGVPDDRAGDIGGPGIGGAQAASPELKVTANVTYARGPFSLFVQERYIDGGMLDRTLFEGVTIDDNSIDSTYYTDLGLTFTLGGGDGWELFANVNNLLDQEPRATPQILGRAGVNEFNPGLYDVLGRRYVFGARKDF